MLYDYYCPELSEKEWDVIYHLPVIHDKETPSEWKERISTTMSYCRDNNHFPEPQKRYLRARKMSGYNHDYAKLVNIAICHSCNQLIYLNSRNYKMDEHCRTNCTRNKFCDISFSEYLKLKETPQASLEYYEEMAIYRYELRMENATNKLKRAREFVKRNKAATIIQNKWLECMYRPGSQKSKQLALHYELWRGIREELRRVNAA